MTTYQNNHAALQGRTRQQSQTKDERVSSDRDIILLSRIPGAEDRKKAELTHGQTTSYWDIIPFRVTAPWYPNLRMRNGMRIGDLPVPIMPGMLDYKLEVPCHSVRGIGRILCLREAFGQECSICEEMFNLYRVAKEQNDANKKEAGRKLLPSWRDFYNVYDYDDSAAGWKWIEIAYTNFEDMLLENINTGTDGIECFWDLATGRSLEISGRQKKLEKNSWVEAVSIKFHPRDPYDESVIDQALPFDQLLVIPTENEVTRLFLGMDQEEEQPAAEQQSTARPGGGRTRPGAAAPPAPQTVDVNVNVHADAGDNECPAGGIFGKDCNQFNECSTCVDEIFNRCIDLQDRINAGQVPDPSATPPPVQQQQEQPARTRTPAPTQHAGVPARTRTRTTEQPNAGMQRTRTRR